jgi:anthranilate phosphoribosyltransferase
MNEVYLKKLVNGNNLNTKEMKIIMEKIMTGELPESLIGAILTALSIKGETVEEITAAAVIMRNFAEKIKINKRIRLDTCGTGGDEKGTINVSTAAAFILSSGGVSVVKHGNRSVTSKCGSADVIEALGGNINLGPNQVEDMIDKINFGFLYAPTFHKAMKYAAPVRKSLSIKTIFNILGPLTNPGKTNYQVVGVFKPELTSKLASAFKNMGSKRVLVVHGMECLDEISITRETKISELFNGEVKEYYISPEDFGLKRGKMKEIMGGTKEENASIIKNVFEGEKGTIRNFIILNAGAGFYVTGKSKTISEGITFAETLIDSGKTKKKLQEYIEYSNSFKGEEREKCI